MNFLKKDGDLSFLLPVELSDPADDKEVDVLSGSSCGTSTFLADLDSLFLTPLFVRFRDCGLSSPSLFFAPSLFMSRLTLLSGLFASRPEND